MTTNDNCDTTRTERVVKWLAAEGDKIDGMESGNITFSFKGRTLKIKIEEYENI